MSKIFLYGGCVIRDGYTPLQESNAGTLLTYVARQSIISAMSPATRAFPTPDKLKSPFQKRMVKGDHDSSLIPQIKSHRDQIDLLVIDTNVERLGVYHLQDGSFVTRSPEMQNAGLIEKPEPPLLKLGTAEHTKKFTESAEQFVSKLRAFGLLEKTLLIDAPLARVDNVGEPFTVTAGMQVDEMRSGLTSITRVLTDLGIETVHMPEELAVGDVNHKWGRLPFHYIPQATQWITGQIQQRIA